MKGRRPRFQIPRVLFFGLGCLAVLGGIRATAESPWKMIGPSGGDVRGIAVNPLDPREMYAAVYSLPSQIYKSEDSGQNWRLTALLGSQVSAIAIAPSSPQILYVLGDTSVFKSGDGGATWREYPLGPSRHGDYGEIAVSRTNPDLVYVCGHYFNSSSQVGMAVFKSTDGGMSWSIKNPTSSQVGGNSYRLAVDPANDSVLYAGGSDSQGGGYFARLFKSLDAGDSWTALAGSMQGNLQAIAIAPANPSRIFVGTDWGVFRSDNGGQTWTSKGGVVSATALAIDPSDPNIVFASYTGTCYRSTDGGDHWSAYKSGLRGDCSSLYAASGQLFYASSTGVYRSDDGGISFRESYTGIFASQVLALVVAPGLPSVLYTVVKADGYFKSDTFGLIWERLPDFADCNDVRKIGVDPTDAGRVLVLLTGT